MSDFIADLEAELRAASTRRLRLAAARAPRPPATAAGLAVSIAVCIAVAGAFVLGHDRASRSQTGAATPAHTTPRSSSPAGGHDPIITDCLRHGKLTRRYTTAQLSLALTHLTAAERKYTPCAWAITHALGKVPQSIPADLKRAFPIFTHPPEARDAIPSGYVKTALRQGGNPHLSRLLGRTPPFQGAGSNTIWILPASKGRLCDIDKEGSGGGLTCTADATAIQGGLVRGIIGHHKGLLFGALADGTTNPRITTLSGHSQPVRTDPSGWFVVSTSLPATLTYTEPNGHLTSQYLAPAPQLTHHPSTSCHHTTPLC